MKRNILFVAVMLVVMVFAFAACNNDNDTAGGTPGDLAGGAATATGLPYDTEGEITVFMWSGSGVFLRDVGRVYIPAEEIFGQNDAAVAATARAFNQIFPNIQINVYSRADGPNSNDIPWAQYRANFEMEFGHFPDIFAVYDLIGDINAGLVADLTIFENDPMFQSFNPDIMSMMNVGGRQFALPQYMIPWGVFVNRSLAEAQNIDVPTPQWTIEQYMRFITNSSPNEWYGAMASPWSFVDSGTRDFLYLLANRGPNDPFVRLNTEAMRNLVAMMPAAIPHTVWPQNGLGNIAGEFMDENWWWGFRFFQTGRLLAHEGDPWMMGDLAHPDGSDHWGGAFMADWDIFPRPATNYMGNHVGMVLDPFAIRNYAMDDGNPELSPEEYQRLLIAWTFLSFMIGDTRAWEARANQMFNDGDSMGFASNDSFPLVTGQAFYDQMEFWYMSGRQRFADANLMPGFQYVLQLWEEGAVVAISDKTHPWHHEFEGTTRTIAFEWLHKYNPDVTGASDSEPHWVDMLFSRLPEWDVEINQRFADAWEEVHASIARFYPVQVRGGR